METLISLVIGIGLSAAAGFRLLVPFLALSLASVFGHFPISPEMQWLNSFPALEALAVGLLLEILAFYIPWFDHLLDVIKVPASIIAGTLITASFTSHLDPLDPFLQWSLAIVAGGGAAAAAKTLAGGTRATSTLTTGGFGNFIVATLEVLGAIALSTLALVLPKLAIILVPLLIGVLGWQGYRVWKSKRSFDLSIGK
ncbi:MAG: DUF4126 domain-containing protein [Oscillatoriales cyanobacterium C42_A2020_001]|nr:DUF4126 domain-containing protein [Leptolyngbyaceae cyanobacterium C42_A2020_001]